MIEMLTGAEPAVGKIALTAVTKAGGALIPPIRRKRLNEQTLRRLRRPEIYEITGRRFVSTPESASAVTEVMLSPEVSRIAISLASALFLRECGKDSDSRVADLRNQFARLVNACGGGHDSNLAAAHAFDRLSQEVSRQIAIVSDGISGMPAELRSAVIRSAADHANAETRNSELLAEFESLTSILEFETDLRGQIQRQHRTMKLPHAGTTRRVPYSELFVDPLLSVPGVVDDDVTVKDLRNLLLRVVILGDPGGGKSTLALKEAYDIASGSSSDDARIPFIVILKDFAPFLSGGLSLPDYIGLSCGSLYHVTPPEGAIEYLLLSGRATVILDGMDELLETAHRRVLVQAVETFASRFPTTPIIVTSRKVGYEEASLDEELFPVARLQEFNPPQISQYSRSWFALDETVDKNHQAELAKSFLDDGDFVADLRSNPLMLSLMCGIYSSAKYIPRNRPDVYEQCALLLFKGWDKQRKIGMPLSFDAHVEGAIRDLALWMYSESDVQGGGLSRSVMVDHVAAYLRAKRFDNDEDALDAASDFIDFCKGRAWVLSEIGVDIYGFTHRTFLEYFAAKQLVRLNTSPASLHLTLRKRILKGEWFVLSQLCLQILEKHTEGGANEFLELVIEDQVRASGSYSMRLRFLTSSLRFVVPTPATVDSIVRDVVGQLASDSRIREASAAAALSLLLSASDENLALVDKYLRKACLARLEGSAPKNEVLLKVLWHTPAYVPRNDASRPFWITTSESRRSDALSDMASAWHSLPWAGVALWVFGLLRLSDLISTHGIASLFSVWWTGRSKLFPISVSILQANSTEMFRKPLLADAADELTRSKVPWIIVDGGNDSFDLNQLSKTLFGEVFAEGRDLIASASSIDRELLLLLSLPYLEQGVASGRSADPTRRDNTYGLLILLRVQSWGETRVRRELQTLGLSGSVESFLVDWAMKRRSVLSAPAPAI